MAIAFKDDFIDRLKAEGKAEGEAVGQAKMLLRVLAARGFHVPDHVRQQVLACTDPAQQEAWVDKAVTAPSLDDVFTD
jgi:hypothetical protein